MNNYVAPNSLNLSMPRGRVLFAPFDAEGVEHGEIDLGEVSSLEFTVGLGFKEMLTSHDSTVHLFEKAITDVKPTLKFTPQEQSLENMALALYADPDKVRGTSASLFSQTKGSEAGATVAIYLDRWIYLGKKAIKSGTIVVDQSHRIHQLSDFTAGTYRVDYENGLLMIKSNNTLGYIEGDADFSYDYGTIDLPTFPFRSTPIRGKLRYIGLSEVGPRHEVIFYKVQIAPDAAIALLKPQDFAGYSFTGDVFRDDDSGEHNEDPYRRVVRLPEASDIEYPS
jgi:hypothetical protein